MYITFNLEHGNEKITNFRIAEAVVCLCNDEHESCSEFDAETVAKMILLQIDATRDGDTNG